MRRTINTKNSSFTRDASDNQECVWRLILRIRPLSRHLSDNLGMRRTINTKNSSFTRDASDNQECVGRLILRIRRLTRDVSVNWNASGDKY